MKPAVPAPGQPGIFYGWVVVGAAFVVMFLGFGVAYSFGAFFKVLQDEFAATRAEVSLVFSLGAFLYFSVGAVSGTLADRLGPRWVVAGGMVLVGLGLVFASRAQSLPQLYLAYGLSVGLGIGFSYVPAIGAVQRWFNRRRGLASGIAVAGIGVGTLVMPFLAIWLIGLSGWRLAYLVMAAMAGILGLGAAMLIEASPAGRGLQPDGAPITPDPSVVTAAAIPGVGLADALRSRPFWYCYVATMATALGLFIPLVHLPSYAADLGLSASTGILLLGLFGVGSIIGRFALGGAADRYGRRNALAGIFVGMAAMLVWWLFSTNVWALGIFAIVFGACYGGFVALIPALMMDYYGGRNVSGIIGALYTSAGFGALAGPTLAGLAYDLAQSYAVPVLAAAAANLLAAGCMAAIPKPQSWRLAHAA